MSRNFGLLASVPTELLPLASSLVSKSILMYESYLDSRLFVSVRIDGQPLFVYDLRSGVSLVTAVDARISRSAHWGGRGPVWRIGFLAVPLDMSLTRRAKKVPYAPLFAADLICYHDFDDKEFKTTMELCCINPSF